EGHAASDQFRLSAFDGEGVNISRPHQDRGTSAVRPAARLPGDPSGSSLRRPQRPVMGRAARGSPAGGPALKMRVADRWLAVVSPLGLLVLWEGLSRAGVLDPRFIASPSAIGRTLVA